MTADIGAAYLRPAHPLHAVLVAGAGPLFIGALLSDFAYYHSYHPQWHNFASWLIFGAMVLTGFALLGSIIALVTRAGRSRPGLLLAAFLVITFVLGLLDALMHARDAWAAMPGGVILSALTSTAILIAIWFASSRARVRA